VNRYTLLGVHELSIAYALVETAARAAADSGARAVTVVRLRLGALSGVVQDALQFSYDIATQGTLLAGSRLEVEAVPVVIHCDRCDRDAALPSIQLFRCPVCNTPSARIVQGRELEIVSLEIEDDNPPD
jgi:hydrogenase nickel incorporation protein HypA/HybF